MKGPAMTAYLGVDATPAIAPLYRLQYEAVQETWVLLYPEGMVKLNQSAGEILARCDGKTAVAAIVADLAKTFAMDDTAGLEADVRAFLAMATERNWVALADAVSEETA